MNPLHAWSLDTLAQEEMRALREHRTHDARDYRAEITRRLTERPRRCLAPASTATGAFQCSLAHSHIGSGQPTHRAYYQHDLTAYVLHEWQERQSKSDLLKEMNARLDWSATERALTPFIDKYDAQHTYDQLRKITHKAEEAPSMSSTPAVVETVVRLRPTNQRSTVGDLKRLIARVEAVGGSDESFVDWDSQSYRWNASVVAHEETAPTPLTDGEKVVLLTEVLLDTTTDERKQEIKNLLALG